MTTAERLTAVAENVQKVYEAGVRDGFTPPESEYLDPDYIYRTTRPADWLPMPRPGDNEAYLLGQLIDGISNRFAATISGNCSVEIGTVENGAFVAKETVSATSGVRFSVDLNPNNYGDRTVDGYKQYMVRISGGFSNIVLTKENRNATPINIVDIVSGKRGEIAAGASNADLACRAIKYIRFVGNGQCMFAGTKFSNCSNLMLVSTESKEPSTYGSSTNAFVNNGRLMYVSPEILGANPDTLYYAFGGSNIAMVKVLGTPKNTQQMFDANSGITRFSSDYVDTSLVTNMTKMFYNCRSLREVIGLNISSVTSLTDIFTGDNSLLRLTFAGETTPGGWTIRLTDTCLDHDALVEMIASLPVATAAATLTITNAPGASALTDAEIAVATAKNWTITR